jgi:hypothetical protein
VAAWLWSAPDLYEGRKLGIVKDFAHHHNPNYRHRSVVREKARILLADGVPVMRVAEQVGVRFQTVYRWKAKWLLPISTAE